MAGLRDPFRYREEAAHFLELAQAATDSPKLRDSYLALALQYERLARILEESDHRTLSGDGNGRQGRAVRGRSGRRSDVEDESEQVLLGMPVGIWHGDCCNAAKLSSTVSG